MRQSDFEAGAREFYLEIQGMPIRQAMVMAVSRRR